MLMLPGSRVLLPLSGRYGRCARVNKLWEAVSPERQKGAAYDVARFGTADLKTRSAWYLEWFEVEDASVRWRRM